MSKPTVGAGWQRAIVTLTGTVVGVVIVGALYWAQAVFIPVALAGFLTFLLSPMVNRLRQLGMPRTPSVIVAVVFTAATLGGISWVVTGQISSLLGRLPAYKDTVREKLRPLNEAAEKVGQFREMMAPEARRPADRAAPAGVEGEPAAPVAAPSTPTRVVLEPERTPWMARMTEFLSPMLEYLGELALAIILVIFMLLKREELRNRIIRLAGQGKIVAATKFVDEAAHRVSRFLLMQAIVNASFGVLFGLGLLVIGVEYAMLWGFLGAMLRYLPYIGPYLAVTFPITLSMAMTEGWTSTLEVIGLFLSLELVISNFIEPRLYGHSMGVSEIAMLVSAAFWAFLWGPIGLVLSSPLTVCLVVLGRYTPQLEFLSVLLGDEPALDAAISFYQRLLARDQDEAEDLVIEEMGRLESPDRIYDAMLLPALAAIKRNRTSGDITVDDEAYALQAIREIVEDIGEGRIAAAGAAAEAEAEAPEPAPGPAGPPIAIFACPAHDEEDRVALEMLRGALDPAQWDVELIAPTTLTSELLARVADRRPAAICITAVPPGGLAHTRYLCKRMRARFPDLKILVGRWGMRDITSRSVPDPAEGAPSPPGSPRPPAAGTARLPGPDHTAAALKEATADAAAPPSPAVIDPMIAGLEGAGADLVATALLETCQQLASLVPVLAQAADGRDRDGGRPAAAGRRAGRDAGRELAAGARTS